MTHGRGLLHRASPKGEMDPLWRCADCGQEGRFSWFSVNPCPLFVPGKRAEDTVLEAIFGPEPVDGVLAVPSPFGGTRS